MSGAARVPSESVNERGERFRFQSSDTCERYQLKRVRSADCSTARARLTLQSPLESQTHAHIALA